VSSVFFLLFLFGNEYRSLIVGCAPNCSNVFTVKLFSHHRALERMHWLFNWHRPVDLHKKTS